MGNEVFAEWSTVESEITTLAKYSGSGKNGGLRDVAPLTLSHCKMQLSALTKRFADLETSDMVVWQFSIRKQHVATVLVLSPYFPHPLPLVPASLTYLRLGRRVCCIPRSCRAV
jgi:hypothetical protein